MALRDNATALCLLPDEPGGQEQTSPPALQGVILPWRYALLGVAALTDHSCSAGQAR